MNSIPVSRQPRARGFRGGSECSPCNTRRQTVKLSISTPPCNLRVRELRGLSALSKEHRVKATEAGRGVFRKVLASQQQGGSEASARIDDRSLKDVKRAVMTAVSNTDRGKDTTYQQRQNILKLIEELEGLNPTANPVDSSLFSGRWSLLYTAPVDEKTADKYAGTEEGPFLARVKPVALGSVRQIRSTQILDPLRGMAENIADFTMFGVKGSLNIKGNVTKAAPKSQGAVRVDVTFQSFVLKIGDWTLPAISLSWINPKGWIDTTFLDEDTRVGRGDKGSIFMAVRARQNQST